jgi:hypothetical protein
MKYLVICHRDGARRHDREVSLPGDEIMNRTMRHPLIAFAIACCLQGTALAQRQPPQKIESLPVSPASPDTTVTLPALKDPATVDQIHEYLQLSGDMDSYRERWIAAVDKERSKGVFQYWPVSYWTDLKAEMGKTDLMPMYITWYQHGVSRDLMQEVLNTYRLVGATLFHVSPACYKLTVAQHAMASDVDQLRLAKTQEVIRKVYAIYKPQIQAASARYRADHPNSVDK